MKKAVKKTIGNRRSRCSDPWDQAPPWAIELRKQNDATHNMLSLVLQRERIIMSEVSDALDEIEASAAANSEAEDSAEAMLTSLSQMVADLKNNQTDPATVARITALSTAIKERAAKLSAAVVAVPK